MDRFDILKLPAAALTLLAFANVAFGQSREYNGPLPARSSAAPATDRIIVKWRAPAGDEPGAADAQVRKLGVATGLTLQRKIAIHDRLEVLHLDRRLAGDELAAVLARLQDDSQVEYAAADHRRQIHAIPNDTLFIEQWYLLSTQPSALRAQQAWDITTGSSGTVIAVLDTGVRFDHPDLLRASLAGKLLPGYDFVSAESPGSFIVANDGDGRDPDPSDPGDWVDAGDPERLGAEDCTPRSSSWHGTRVAGLIGALTDNATGVAGTVWNAWILPVRVLGKCGGYDSDIIAAMRWAAGLPVSGVPANPYPAHIVNLSLGSAGTCTAAYQATVNELVERGALVVASAGNRGGPVGAPANCSGVLAVAGLRHAGTKVGFSNLGPAVDIGAPGGNCVNVGVGQPCLFSIIVPTNFGTTTPAASGYTDAFNFNVGTSFAAPLVAGTAALMHSVNARLASRHLIERLQQGATPFPANPNTGVPDCRVPANADDLQISECYCTTNTCGAGMLNALGAVTQALRPAVALQISGVIAPGQDLTLDGSGSAAACNRSVVAYEWSIVSSTGAPPALSSTDQPAVTLQAPASGNVVVRLAVTDDQGAQDTADVTVTATNASTTTVPPLLGEACPTAIVPPADDPPGGGSPPPTPPSPPPTSPPATGSGRRGGGSFGWELLALALLVSLRSRSISTSMSRQRSRQQHR